MGLPPNFRDRPWPARWALDAAVALRLRPVKGSCCRKFDAGRPCCKGCALLYGPDSPSRVRRLLGRWARAKKA